MPAAPTKTSEMRFLWKCLLKLEVFNIPVYRNVLVLWPPRVCRLTQGHRTPAVGKHKAGLRTHHPLVKLSAEKGLWEGAAPGREAIAGCKATGLGRNQRAREKA